MNRLIVSLDIDNLDKAIELIDILSPKIEIFKVGIFPFTSFGDRLLDKLQSLNKKVFLDLKFHDIPNTVKNATKAAAQKGIYMMSLHCLGGLSMLQAAVAGVKEANVSEMPLLLGVTVLTSMNAEEMRNIGFCTTVQNEVITLAKLARNAGLNGVVASPKEVKIIKEKIGQDFIVVTPGIRLAETAVSKDDQQRILTAGQAIAEGADYVVVGRPIIEADDPLAAANKIIAEIKHAEQKL
jgi:orotidine-5'-phosphate decarboxylase